MVYLRRPVAGELERQVSELGERKKGDLGAAHSQMMMREYGIGAQILRDLGIHRIELLTSSKKNLVGLKTFGIEISAQTPLSSPEVQQHSFAETVQ